jgi:transcription antitermination factor NusG
MEDTLSWYAIRVRPRHEKRVNYLLELRKIVSFLPLYSTRRKWADRQQTLRLPLFPGYVFCQFAANQQVLVLRTPGVIDVVRAGTKPASIDPQEIQALQQLDASGCNAEPWPSVMIGEAVQVVSGPFAGQTGIVAAQKSGFRLVLTVTLLRRSVLVEIDQACLGPSHLKMTVK